MKKILILLLAFGLLLTTVSVATAATTEVDLFYRQQGVIKYAEDTSGTKHSTDVSGTLPSDCPEYTTVIGGDTYSPKFFYVTHSGDVGIQYTKNGVKYEVEFENYPFELTGRPVCAPSFAYSGASSSQRVADFLNPVEIDGQGVVLMSSVYYDPSSEIWMLIEHRRSTPVNDDWDCTDPAPALNGENSMIVSCRYAEAGGSIELEGWRLFEQEYDGGYPSPRLVVGNTYGNARYPSYDGTTVIYSDNSQENYGRNQIFKAPYLPAQANPSVGVIMTDCVHDCWYSTIAFGEDIFAYEISSGAIKTGTLSTCVDGNNCNFESVVYGSTWTPYYELAIFNPEIPNPQPTPPTPPPPPPAPQISPDVVPGGITMYEVGDECYFGTTISNIGNGLAWFSTSKITLEEVGVAHTYHCQINTFPILPYSSMPALCGESFEDGTSWDITVTADFGNNIVESNENNNEVFAGRYSCNTGGA
jgi:hypothetical protein